MRTHITTNFKVKLVYFNYNFECDWLIELSDNKLFNNKLSGNNNTIIIILIIYNLESELVGNRSFFKRIKIEEIVFYVFLCLFYD